MGNPEYSNDKWDQDPHGHGTHCSGTVSAIGGNDKGVVGVIPNNAGERFQLVIAIDSNKSRASFSTFNDQVEISAPGVSIESSLPGNRYAKWSGTSMATPHVAGVAGLLWMYFPECENYQIRNVLLATAEDLGSNDCDDYYGFGVVRAKAAYELLSKSNCGGNLGVTDGNSGGCDQLTSGPAPPSAPNPAPSSSAPNPAPHTAPTMYPTHTAPTPYPTEVPPTPYPTGKACAVRDEPCKMHGDCCKKKCNRVKGFCRK